jgi:hypothetical protein
VRTLACIFLTLTRKEDSGIVAPYQLVKDATAEPSNNNNNSPRVGIRPGYPNKIFKHFRDEKLKTYMSKVCRLLGYYCDPMFTVDYFLNVIQDRNMSRYTKQAVFVLNELVLGRNTLYILVLTYRMCWYWY